MTELSAISISVLLVGWFIGNQIWLCRRELDRIEKHLEALRQLAGHQLDPRNQAGVSVALWTIARHLEEIQKRDGNDSPP